MAATEDHSGATSLPESSSDDHDVMLPVRVQGGVHHYSRKVTPRAIDTDQYDAPPADDADTVRVYLVEVHRLDERDEAASEIFEEDWFDTGWSLVYATRDGRPVCRAPTCSWVWRTDGIAHAARVPEDAPSEDVDEAEMDRLRQLVEECHEVSAA